MAEYMPKWTETFPLGSSLTFDYEANRGYLHVFPNPDAYGVARSEVLWEPDALVLDIDTDGRSTATTGRI